MKHANLVKNTALLFINKFSSALSTFILLPLYTKYFSAESYGVMDLIVGYITLVAAVLSLRIDMGIFKYLIDARGNLVRTKTIISSSLGLMIILLLITAIIAVVLCLFVTIPFYYLVVFAVVANILFGVMSQVTRGLGFTKDFVVISIVVTILSFVVSVVGILFMHFDAEIILIALTISQLVGALLMIFKTRMYTMVQKGASSWHIQKQLLQYSAPLVVDSTSFWIMNTSSRTILTVVVGAAANGMYAVAGKFATVIEQVIGVFFQSFIETATLYAKEPNKSELYSDVMNKYLKLLWSGCLVLIVLIPFIFPFLIRGEEFVGAVLFIPIMIAAVMVRAVQNFISAVYQANGHTKQIASTTIIGALINLVINIVLVFFIGAWSVAIALFISYLVLSIYRYFDIRKYDIILIFDSKVLAIFLPLVVAALILYYSNNIWLNAVNVVVVISVVLIINRKIIQKLMKRVFKKYLS